VPRRAADLWGLVTIAPRLGDGTVSGVNENTRSLQSIDNPSIDAADQAWQKALHVGPGLLL
jgi:hypothetical protein